MATLKDISKESGFSISAVSAVLNGKSKHNIPIETQNKIKASARKLNYQPNLAARKLRQGSSQTVILIFWAKDSRDTMMTRFLKGINIANLGNEVEVIFNFYNPGNIKAVKNLLDSTYCNGAIICNTSQADLQYIEETEFTIPIILYNRDSKKYSNVVVNSEKVGIAAADILSTPSVQNYLVIGEEHKYPGSTLRELSFIQKINESNPNNIVKSMHLHSKELDDFELINNQIKKLSLPVNIFCLNDRLALMIIRAMYKQNLIINKDINIISVGNEDPFIASNLVPALSTIEIPIESMAEKCIELILAKINSETKVESIEYDIRVKNRETT